MTVTAQPPDDGRAPILVLRTARASVLHAYLDTVEPARRIVVLGHPFGAPPPHVQIVTAPPGFLRWRRLPPDLRAKLRAQRWAEVVILHNQGDDSYAPIHAIVCRIGLRTPLRIFYADGSPRMYRSWLRFFFRRAPLVLAATLLLPCVAAAFAPFWIASQIYGRLRAGERAHARS